MNKFSAYFNNFFWLFATYLLAPFFYFLIFLKKRRKNDQMRILVIQTAKIGDLVCTTPVFRAIKKKFPSSYLSVIITSQTKDILKNNPRVDEIILITDYQGLMGRLRLLIKLRKDRYDWAVSLFPGLFESAIPFLSLIPDRVATIYQYLGKSAGLLSILNNHRLEYKRHTQVAKHFSDLLKFLGIEEFLEKKEIFIQPEEEKKALDFLDKNNLSSNDLLVGIAITAGVKLKEWQPEKYAVLADQLIKELSTKIIFIGSADDRKTIERVQKIMKNRSVDASGLFKLNEVPALMKKLKLFIAGDTGPMHIADAVGIPLVVIAGPVDKIASCPTHSLCKVIQKDIYCVPCLFALSAPHFCKEGHLHCLKEIIPEEVFQASQELIGNIN